MAELHPDLQSWVVDTPSGPMLKHPLCYSAFLDEPIYDHLNSVYEHAVVRADKALAAGDLERWIWTHERPWRMRRLIELHRARKLSPAEVAAILPGVWTDTEFPHLHDQRSLRSLFRTAGQIGDPLPPGQLLTIWRGASRPAWARRGMSWTLDYGKAQYFSKRWSYPEDRPTVVRRIVKRQDVLAYFNDRNEEEIVI